MADVHFITNINVFQIEYKETNKYLIEENHYHNEYEIMYVKKGKLRFYISDKDNNDKEYIVKENTLVFINNLESHWYEILEFPYTRYVILMNPEFLSAAINNPTLTSIFKYRPKNFSNVYELRSDETIQVIEHLDIMLQEYSKKSSYWELNIKSLLRMFLINIFRFSSEHFPLDSLQNTVGRRVITDIQTYIEKHFTEEIYLKELATMFHIDKYYISRLFRNVTGFTFKSFIIQHKITYAQHLLIHSDYSVSKIATDAGFNSVNHFIRAFKQVSNVTPFQYRKTFLNT